MDRPLINLLTRATRAGLEFTATDAGLVRTRGTAPPELLDELRTRRDDIVTLLAGNCANCNAPPWVHEADTHIPWCHPCATRRGLALLRTERPDLIDETVAA